MTRFAELSHGLLVLLVISLPLLRLGWDQWAQTTVLLVWSFLIVLGSVLLLLGRSGDVAGLGKALRRMGFLGGIVVGSGLLSTWFSPFPHSALPAYLNDFPAFAFLLLGAATSGERRSAYQRALIGSGVLAVAVSVLFRGAAFGPILNPNLLAGLLLLVAPLALEFSFQAASSKSARLFWVGSSTVLILGWISCRSWAGYGTALFQGALAAGIFSRRNKWKVRNLLWFAGLCLVIGAGLLTVRSEWAIFAQGDPDRWNWGLTALRVFTSHPVWGVGPGAFGEAYPIYRASSWGLNSLYAHNFILEFLAERGIVGAGALFVLMGILFVRARRAVSQGEGPGLFLGMAGFCFYNCFHMGFSFPALYWLFFLTAGLAGSREYRGGAAGTPPHINRFPALETKKPLLVATGGLWLLLGFASYALFRGDQCLARARYYFSAERWSAAQAEVNKGLVWNRWSPSLFELRAALRLKSSDGDGAKADLDRAVQLAPTSAAFQVDAAEFALERGDVDRALSLYEKATQLLPLKVDYWERWADLLSDRGRRVESLQAYRGALRALDDPRVLGGDGTRRAERARRVEEKIQRLTHVKKN